MNKLSEEQVAVHLAGVPNWRSEGDALVKTYRLPGFREAIEFVRNIAELAERANHHPELLVRFREVTVTLTTHDSGGITGKDFLLAQQIESIGAEASD